MVWAEENRRNGEASISSLSSITTEGHGEPAAEIPDTPGDYHITIDFSGIIAQDGNAHIADILMWGIASFNIDYHEG